MNDRMNVAPTRRMLRRWLAEEARSAAVRQASEREASADEAADLALASFFASALSGPTPSPALSARLHAAASEAAARRAVVFGMPRRLVERLAAVLLLVAGLAAAAVQALFSETAAPALARLTPARVFSSLAEGVFFLFRVSADWVGTAVEALQTITHLSGAVATVAGTPPVAAFLGLSLLLAAVAFKALRALLATERGWTYVERN
jgi:hypothetical protein